MNYHAHKNVEEAKRREAERQALHSLALENIVLSPETLALREKVMTGELTEADYRATVIAEATGSDN